MERYEESKKDSGEILIENILKTFTPSQFETGYNFIYEYYQKKYKFLNSKSLKFFVLETIREKISDIFKSNLELKFFEEDENISIQERKIIWLEFLQNKIQEIDKVKLEETLEKELKDINNKIENNLINLTQEDDFIKIYNLFFQYGKYILKYSGSNLLKGIENSILQKIKTDKAKNMWIEFFNDLKDKNYNLLGIEH